MLNNFNLFKLSSGIRISWNQKVDGSHSAWYELMRNDFLHLSFSFNDITSTNKWGNTINKVLMSFAWMVTVFFLMCVCKIVISWIWSHNCQDKMRDLLLLRLLFLLSLFLSRSTVVGCKFYISEAEYLVRQIMSRLAFIQLHMVISWDGIKLRIIRSNFLSFLLFASISLSRSLSFGFTFSLFLCIVRSFVVCRCVDDCAVAVSLHSSFIAHILSVEEP